MKSEQGLAAVPHVAKATKRRIGGKTPVSETSGFPTQPQVTKQEQRRLRGIGKEKARKAAVADDGAKARAKDSFMNGPSLAGSMEGLDEAQVEEELVDPFEPHPSHDLREMSSAAVT